MTVDERVDIYSLGATLYELLTLQAVFPGDNRHDLLRQIAFDEPVPIHKRNKSVPRDLETIVMKSIAKRPEDRYTSAKAMAADLQCFLQQRPIAAKPPSLFDHTAKWARRHMGTLAAAAAVMSIALVAAVIVAVVSVHGRNVELAEKARAEAHLKTARELLEVMTEQIASELQNTPQASKLQEATLLQAADFYRNLTSSERDESELQLAARADAAPRGRVAVRHGDHETAIGVVCRLVARSLRRGGKCPAGPSRIGRREA